MAINKGQVADPPCVGNARAGDSRESLICEIPLDVNQPTDLTLSLTALSEGSSGLNLNRVEWIDPNVRLVRNYEAPVKILNEADWRVGFMSVINSIDPSMRAQCWSIHPAGLQTLTTGLGTLI